MAKREEKKTRSILIPEDPLKFIVNWIYGLMLTSALKMILRRIDLLRVLTILQSRFIDSSLGVMREEEEYIDVEYILKTWQDAVLVLFGIGTITCYAELEFDKWTRTLRVSKFMKLAICRRDL